MQGGREGIKGTNGTGKDFQYPGTLLSNVLMTAG